MPFWLSVLGACLVVLLFCLGSGNGPRATLQAPAPSGQNMLKGMRGVCMRAVLAAGHTASWGKGYPELLTDCYDAQERPTGVKGPINPARNETYALLWKLLREAAALFPDSYIHLGGDEVPFDCWQVHLFAFLCHLARDIPPTRFCRWCCETLS